MRWFVLLFLIVPVVFIGVGAFQAYEQAHKLDTYEPVAATITESGIASYTGDDDTSYEPDIYYTYQVDGRTFEGNTALPISETRSDYGWARDIASRYTAGQRTTAYVDPDDPTQAFLVRQASFLPYLFILFPMIFVAIPLWIMKGIGASEKRPREPALRADGWARVPPRSRIAHRRRGVLTAALGWYGVGGIACGHFFLGTPEPHETLAVAASVIYGIIGLIPLGIAAYYVRLDSVIADPDVRIKPDRVEVGDRLSVRLEQLVYNGAFIPSLELALVCIARTKTRSGNKTSIGDRTDHREEHTALENYLARPGEVLMVTHGFEIPEDGHASSPPGMHEYPRYRWRIDVKVAISGQPDYRGRFPIKVGGSAASDTAPQTSGSGGPRDVTNRPT